MLYFLSAPMYEPLPDPLTQQLVKGVYVRRKSRQAGNKSPIAVIGMVYYRKGSFPLPPSTTMYVVADLLVRAYIYIYTCGYIRRHIYIHNPRARIPRIICLSRTTTTTWHCRTAQPARPRRCGGANLHRATRNAMQSDTCLPT